MADTSSHTYSAAGLLDMPGFWDGLAQELQDLLTVHSSIPAEVHYLADIRHWVLIQMAIALHFENQRDNRRPRLSPKLLLQALDGTGIASRNTVQAFLRELTRVQFTDLPPRETVRQRAPQVSEKSKKLMLIYLGIHLRALDTIDGGNRSPFLSNTPMFLPYLQPCFARRICVSPAWYSPPAEIKCFTNSASGSSILHDLVLASQHQQADAADRIWIGPVSTAKLSQRYQVSTAHVARMLSKARKLDLMGWARPGRRGDCWLSARLARSYLRWQAEKLAALSVAYSEARAAFEAENRA
ncbi:MAG: hypothetical protein QNK42_14615 [Pseudodonghicola sp.]|nr:hypothetical protein [Pseudodonghicola sp.]